MLSRLQQPRLSPFVTMTNSVDILFQDDALLIADKPAGLLAVPGRGADKQDCLVSRLQQHHPHALVVHRLDMSTSGLMVFALGPDVQRILSRMFRDRDVTKSYTAVLQGHVSQDSGEVSLPLICDWPNRPRQKVDLAEGKPSLTRFRVLTRNAASTRVELEPVTGRSHQLRVHMAALQHPILGDPLYGDPTLAPRLLLHATSLSFSHPLNSQPLNFFSPPPF